MSNSNTLTSKNSYFIVIFEDDFSFQDTVKIHQIEPVNVIVEGTKRKFFDHEGAESSYRIPIPTTAIPLLIERK